MYINRKIQVVINPSNYKHYIKYNKNIINRNTYLFDIDELTKTSSAIIDVKCDDCGIIKSIKYKYYKKYGFSNGVYYCKKCNTKRKIQKKYGVDNVFQIDNVKYKIKETLIKKYNVNNISKVKKIQEKKQLIYKNRTNEKKLEINNKRKKTIQNKYGTHNISLVNNIIEQKKQKWLNKTNIELQKINNKRKKTLLKRYNIDHNFKIPFVKEQIKTTNLKKYNVDIVSKNYNIKQNIIKTLKKSLINNQYKNIKNLISINNDTFTIKCNICSENFEINKQLFYKRRETNTIICTICNPVDSHISGKENTLLQYITSIYNGKIITSDRKILNGKELDIYLPDLKLAFEFNGIYWHNELYKDKNYHYIKTKLCKNKNIQLFHIYEDDWFNKQEIIKSMILNKIGKTNNKIYARKTIIKEISSKESSLFYEQNHIQGKSIYSINIGLYYNNMLVSVMSFKKNKNAFELVRFANKLYMNVVGGASKLLNYFINTYNPKSIYTFSNNDYSYGDLYKKLNFYKHNKIKPDYSYIINGKRKHKFNFRKKNLKKMGFDIDNKTEHEICLEHNIFRIYDSGKIKWIKYI